MYVSQTSYHKTKKKHGYLITDYWTTCSPVFNYFTGENGSTDGVVLFQIYFFAKYFLPVWPNHANPHTQAEYQNYFWD